MIREKMLLALQKHGHEVSRRISTIAPTPGAILASEMTAFMSLCWERGLHLVVESGRGLGYSTQCVSVCGTQGISIDLNGDDDRSLHKVTRGIRLEVADGFKRIPEIINRLRGRDVAVLLDGPGGHKAIHLADRILESTTFVAIHDLSRFRWSGRAQFNPERMAFERKFPSAWISDDESVMKPWRHLDAGHVKVSGRSSWQTLTEYRYGLGIIAGGLWREDAE